MFNPIEYLCIFHKFKMNSTNITTCATGYVNSISFEVLNDCKQATTPVQAIFGTLSGLLILDALFWVYVSYKKLSSLSLVSSDTVCLISGIGFIGVSIAEYMLLALLNGRSDTTPQILFWLDIELLTTFGFFGMIKTLLTYTNVMTLFLKQKSTRGAIKSVSEMTSELNYTPAKIVFLTILISSPWITGLILSCIPSAVSLRKTYTLLASSSFILGVFGVFGSGIMWNASRTFKITKHVKEQLNDRVLTEHHNDITAKNSDIWYTQIFTFLGIAISFATFGVTLTTPLDYLLVETLFAFSKLILFTSILFFVMCSNKYPNKNEYKKGSQKLNKDSDSESE
jgi:hypothetical protein